MASLFILPEIILPLMGRNGFFLEGQPYGRSPISSSSPMTEALGGASPRAPTGSSRLALMVYNWFTVNPSSRVGSGSIQTFG